MKSKIKELEKKDKDAEENGISGLDDDLFKDEKKHHKKAIKEDEHTKIVFHKEKSDEEK